MIVRMSKIEIVGAKELLEDTLALLSRLSIFQIEPVVVNDIEKQCQDHVRPYVTDEKALSEIMFLEDLTGKINDLFSVLPQVPLRKSYLAVPPVLDTISSVLQKHLEECRAFHKRLMTLQSEAGELQRYDLFLRSISPLIEDVEKSSDLDFIGLTIKDPSLLTPLRGVISRLTDWKYELLTENVRDGTLAGLIIIEKQDADRVKKALSDEQIPEFPFPPSLKNLPLPEKISYIGQKMADINRETEDIQKRQRDFAHRWLPIYLKTVEWINEKVSLHRASAAVFETRMCFCIIGWMPSSETECLIQALTDAFQGRVVLEEKELLEKDVERIPVALKNPPYFRPFELLVKFLPLPRYSSYDPTPFIGIFFPLFFGMILGDAGYGVVLVILAGIMMQRGPKKGEIADAGRILLVSASASIFFGILYGEYFGQLGKDVFGFEPLFIERSHAAVPMLYFAVGVGFVHVVLGLFLGILSAVRKRAGREAAFGAVQIVLILLITALIVSFIRPFPFSPGRPITILILMTVPLLLLTGGILAPLEFLKNIGNIISYARIMAIGFASVLLAFVANSFAGLSGDLVIGVIVAGLLHVVNIILGVFSPTIHSLRLHYVEFFSKFIEHGGRKFEPLRKGG